MQIQQAAFIDVEIQKPGINGGDNNSSGDSDSKQSKGGMSVSIEGGAEQKQVEKASYKSVDEA